MEKTLRVGKRELRFVERSCRILWCPRRLWTPRKRMDRDVDDQVDRKRKKDGSCPSNVVYETLGIDVELISGHR